MKKIYLLILSMSLFCLLMARAKDGGRRVAFYGPYAISDSTPGHDTIPRPPVDTLTPPVDSTHNPGDTLHHHGYPPHGLGDSTHIPGDSTHLPGDSTHNPGDTLHMHGYPPHGPGDSTHIPGDSTHLPGDSTHLPGDSTHLPGDSTHLPGDSTHLPGDTTRVPVDSLPYIGHPCALAISVSRDPQQSNRVTFSISDSAGVYDSVFWRGLRIKDSLLLPVYSGATWTNTFTDTGCYYIWVTALRRDTNLICVASTTLCIDSLPSVSGDALKAYPNPVYSQTFLDLNLDRDQKVVISIFNSMGNLMQASMAAGSKGLNHLSVPTGSLPTGIYYIQVKYGDTTKKSKFQKF